MHDWQLQHARCNNVFFPCALICITYLHERFVIGNTETLNVTGIRDKVIDYYQSRYSANLVSATNSDTLTIGVYIVHKTECTCTCVA